MSHIAKTRETFVCLPHFGTIFLKLITGDETTSFIKALFEVNNFLYICQFDLLHFMQNHFKKKRSKRKGSI